MHNKAAILLLAICICAASPGCCAHFEISKLRVSVVNPPPNLRLSCNSDNSKMLKLDFTSDTALVDIAKRYGRLQFRAYVENADGTPNDKLENDTEFADVYFSQYLVDTDLWHQRKNAEDLKYHVNEATGHIYSAYMFADLKYNSSNSRPPSSIYDLVKNDYQIRFSIEVWGKPFQEVDSSDIIITKDEVLELYRIYENDCAQQRD